MPRSSSSDSDSSDDERKRKKKHKKEHKHKKEKHKKESKKEKKHKSHKRRREEPPVPSTSIADRAGAEAALHTLLRSEGAAGVRALLANLDAGEAIVLDAQVGAAGRFAAAEPEEG